MNNTDIKTGDRVLCKVGDFPPWPAVVVPQRFLSKIVYSGKRSKNYVCVAFFNDDSYYWKEPRHLTLLSEKMCLEWIKKNPKSKDAALLGAYEQAIEYRKLYEFLKEKLVQEEREEILEDVKDIPAGEDPFEPKPSTRRTGSKSASSRKKSRNNSTTGAAVSTITANSNTTNNNSSDQGLSSPSSTTAANPSSATSSVSFSSSSTVDTNTKANNTSGKLSSSTNSPKFQYPHRRKRELNEERRTKSPSSEHSPSPPATGHGTGSTHTHPGLPTKDTSGVPTNGSVISKASTKNSQGNKRRRLDYENRVSIAQLLRNKLQRNLVQRNEPPSEKEYNESDILFKTITDRLSIDPPFFDYNALRASKLYKLLKVIAQDQNLARYHENCKLILSEWSPIIAHIKQDKERSLLQEQERNLETDTTELQVKGEAN